MSIAAWENRRYYACKRGMTNPPDFDVTAGGAVALQPVKKGNQRGFVDAELGGDLQLGALGAVTADEGEDEPVTQVGQSCLAGNLVECLAQRVGRAVGEPGQVVHPGTARRAAFAFRHALTILDLRKTIGYQIILYKII